jgi:uncharacterized protein (TIGR02594 family)
MTVEPSWLARARGHIGVREVPGRGDSPVIQRWLRSLRAWWSDDATPWCGVFVAAMMQPEGFALPRHWYRARAWLEFGQRIPVPNVGCIVVFEREGGGHVGFAIGYDDQRRLMVLGGNQGDAVSIAPFDRARVLEFRWPINSTAPQIALPRVDSRGLPTSRNEA